MSYQGISVKEAVNNVNGNLNGWFLPPIQRPYVWGNRYESELYICKLFDSIIRGYPIGGLIIWNSEKEIHYREFMRDYKIGDIQSFVDKGLAARPDKWLVYDGQQRLQTLYSCLKYTLNSKILVYDTLFNLEKDYEDPNLTGFSFVEKNTQVLNNILRMNELFAKNEDENKSDFRRTFVKNCDGLKESEISVIENNIDKLWDIFVKIETKSLSYFPIQYKDETKVNEIFQRLNTGGIPLSQADLLFSRIKEKNYDFEENLQSFSSEIYSSTGNGYIFNSYDILQLLNLIIKGTTRVDSDKTKVSEVNEFPKTWEKIKQPLSSFFSEYLWGVFKINNNSIVPQKIALLPLIIYFYEISKKSYKFKNIESPNLQKLNKYFILSQINNWTLQSQSDNFTREIIKSGSESENFFEFPLEKIVGYVDEQKSRSVDLFESRFIDYDWFSLKVLTPNRVYQFVPKESGRFNPEIDHIFPKRLKDQNEKYYSEVNVIWNKQPVSREINNYKRRRHPKEFFSSAEGKKYIDDYDFLPSKDISNAIWDEPLRFIEERKALMKKYLKDKHDLELK